MLHFLVHFRLWNKAKTSYKDHYDQFLIILGSFLGHLGHTLRARNLSQIKNGKLRLFFRDQDCCWCSANASTHRKHEEWWKQECYNSFWVFCNFFVNVCPFFDVLWWICRLCGLDVPNMHQNYPKYTKRSPKNNKSGTIVVPNGARGGAKYLQNGPKWSPWGSLGHPWGGQMVQNGALGGPLGTLGGVLGPLGAARASYLSFDGF